MMNFSIGQVVQYRYGSGWLNATIVKIGQRRITIELEQFTNPLAGPVEMFIARIVVNPQSLTERTPTMFVIKARGMYVKVNRWTGSTLHTDPRDASKFSTREAAEKQSRDNDEVVAYDA